MSDSSTPSSSSPSFSQKIYFKDRNGELKGPYTERQVQEWYREKWFDSEFQFCFLTENEMPSDDTQFITLGELRARFGPCCPFQRVEMEDSGLEMLRKRAEALEKELTTLRKECEQVRALKQRVIKLEKKIQALTVSPSENKENKENKENEAPTSADAPEAKSAAPIAQTIKSRYADMKWYDELVDLIVESFDLLGNVRSSRADFITKKLKLRTAQFKYVEEEQVILVEAVMKKMKESKEYYRCMFCDEFFLQPNHAFHHINLYHKRSKGKNEALDDMNDAILDLVSQVTMRWFTDAVAVCKIEEEKYDNLEITATMRPTKEFILHELFEKMLGEFGTDKFIHNTNFFDKQFAKLKNGLDVKIEKALRKHIGDAQTFCDVCECVTGDVEEYFTHLRRFHHVMNMKRFHIPTIIANRLANEMAVQIFFKDRTGSLKGPFTEREVQEWYREKHFDSSFAFCILAEGETVSDSTEFVTLDSLCERNGDGCPFKKIEKEGGEREELEKRIEQIGKELAELRVNVESVAAIEKRLKKCEERIEKLQSAVPVDSADKENAAPAAAAASTAKHAAAKASDASEKKKKKEEPKKDWMDEAVDFVVAYFDMLRRGDFGKAKDLLATPIIPLAEQRLAPERVTADHTLFAEKLVKKMEESDHFYCAVCRMTMITPRQALIHAIGGEHYARAEHELGVPHVAKLVKKIIMIAGYAPDRWVNADMATREEERRKYGTNISSPLLRPTNDFIMDLCDRVTEEVFPGCTALSKQQIVDIALPKFKNGLAARIVAELDEHIGSAQTFCDLCKTRTGDREGFYAHLMRYDHTKTTAIIHAQTIAVNIVKGRGGQSSVDTGTEPTRRYVVYPAAGH